MTSGPAQAPTFVNRYRFTGRLTTLTSLHVGTGESRLLQDRIGYAPSAPNAPPIEYNSFISGAGDQLYLPGSTLKGVVRAWLARYIEALNDNQKFPIQELMEHVFGSKDTGGKAEFHDAPLTTITPGTDTYRWWDSARGTCVSPNVAINPHTRTPEHQLLYYTEFAPPQTVFTVTITAQDLRVEERDLLLGAVAQGFAANQAEPIRVGAGSADGWGLMSWSDRAVEIIEGDDVREWLRTGAKQRYDELFRSLEVTVPELPAGDPSRVLQLTVTLQFEGAMVVSDPSRQGEFAGPSDEPGLAHAMIRHRTEEPYLPASSVRGALRAQGRRIWQTLAHGAAGTLDADDVRKEAKRSGDETALHLFYRVFGAPGWQAPLAIPDFKLLGTPCWHRQEFVAIDRFTGGAANKKKFRAESLYAPVFEGIIRVDLKRWEAAKVPDGALLLLLYLLRDLQEGDVQFGLGASKGYGACTAQITADRVGDLPAIYGGNRLVDVMNTVLGAPDSPDRTERLADPLLDQWAASLVSSVGNSGGEQ